MKGHFSKIKSFFSGSPSNNYSMPTIQPMVPRIVNFGSPQNEKSKTQLKEDKQITEEIIEQIKDCRYDGVDKYPHFKEIGLNKGQVVEGQTIILYQPQFIQQKKRHGKYQQIKLIVTDYKLYILDGKSDIQSFSLSKIEKLQKYINNEKHMKILITLKDGRKYKFKVNLELIWKRIFDQIQKFAFVKNKIHFFAFQFYKFNKQVEFKFKGWKIYNPLKQFERMGLNLKNNQSSDFKVLDNKNGRICDTYPEILVVPSRIPQDSLIRGSKFRSRNRMPGLSYAYEYKLGCFSSMYRSSQSKTGVKNNRSKDDQIMLNMIGNPKLNYSACQTTNFSYQTPNCVIYDARGYIAALGNKISGKGYESTQYYTNCKIQFLNIPNIHAVRDSYNKVIKAVFGQDSKFFIALADSQWYDYVFLILNGAVEIANNLKKGINVLVHCSDGWDRTAQLCALVGIMLDPYYRTIQGFQVLIQKDWIHFGHQFSTRLGQGINDPASQQRSQVFLQFLDCVSQILYQFPSQFEFNSNFLKQLGQQAYSNIFGNFLCNCELQMKKYKIDQQTVSLWSFIQIQKQQYLNAFYMPQYEILQISTSQKNMRFFKQLFLAHVQAFKDIYDIYSCKFTEDNLQIMYKQLKKQKQLLMQRYAENKKILEQLDLQILKNQTDDDGMLLKSISFGKQNKNNDNEEIQNGSEDEGSFDQLNIQNLIQTVNQHTVDLTGKDFGKNIVNTNQNKEFDDDKQK